MADVSVIILTFNEEKNLPDCLDSVKGWAKEVFVVDSYSTDKTVDIALSRAKEGVQVVQHPFKDYSTQWNWALAHLPLKGAWTLKLDGDERVTEGFRKESTAFFPGAPTDVEGVYFRRRIFFLGKELIWGGIKSNFDLRLWRTGKAVFEDRAVNEHALVKGKTVRFESLVDHKDNKGLADWIEKHNRYTSLEAAALTRGNFGSKWRRLYWQFPFFRSEMLFLYGYFLRMGFLDGAAGFHRAYLRAYFVMFVTDAKLQECRRTGRLPEVPWPERGKPHPALARSALQKRVNQVLGRKKITGTRGRVG